MSKTYGEKTDLPEFGPDRIISREVINRFGERLKLAMRGMTNVELAKKSGLSEATIRKYLQGKIYPAIDNLAAVAEACEVSVTWLLTGSDGLVRNNEEKDDSIAKASVRYDGISEMLSMLLTRLPTEEQHKLAEQLIRKGVDTLLSLTEDDNVELLNLSGEIKEIALMLKTLPAARLREICANLAGDERAAPLIEKSVNKAG